MMSAFGQTFFIAIFSGEIRAEYGLNHAEWGGIYTIGTAAAALAMLWAGTLADRYRIRSLGMVVLACLALACLFMSFNRVAFLLPVVIFTLRLFGQGMAAHVSFVGISRWFVATRGKALAVAVFGFAIGEASLPIIFVWLKRSYEWRQLWIVAALVCVAVIPVLAALLRRERTPASMAKTEVSAGMGGRQWTRAEAIRHPLFLCLLPALMAFPAFGTAFWFHQVHFTEVKGWDHLALVAVIPLGTLAFIGSTAFYGWAIDKFGVARLLPLFQLPLVVSFALHAYAPSLAFSAVGIFFMGLAGGGNSTLLAACWSEYFGTRHIGAVKAAVAAVMVLGSAIGPGLSGWLIETGVELPQQYWIYACVFALSSAMIVPGIRIGQRDLAAV
ncbi:MAG: MFS transporter [Rhodobacteraceae bacterium]|nr:MFS transporter [Paracoccaceae bacterium]